VSPVRRRLALNDRPEVAKHLHDHIEVTRTELDAFVAADAPYNCWSSPNYGPKRSTKEQRSYSLLKRPSSRSSL